MKNILLFLCYLTFLYAKAQVQVASDINQGTRGSTIKDFFEFKNLLYFSAETDDQFSNTSARKLWKTDATEAGTVQMENMPSNGILKSDNYIYYFNAGKFWKSDGTANGTAEVVIEKNILVNYGVYKDFFYYLAYTNIDRDYGLYKTDGTTTTLIKTFAANTYADYSPRNTGNAIFEFDASRFIIYIYNKDIGDEPYISDGTEAGTILLKDVTLGSGHSTASKFYKANDKYLFINNFKIVMGTDGTEAGTIQLNWFGGYSSQKIIGMTSFNNKVYYAFDDELWESDGTILGTKLVFENKDADGEIQAIINRGTDLLLLLKRGIHLFDGTSSNTTKLATPDITTINTEYAATNTKVYFIANYKGEGNRLWTTDGTSTGTTSIAPFWPDGNTPYGFLKTMGENLLFSLATTAGDTYNMGELWLTDGTSAGTKLLKDINKTGNSSSSPKFQTNLNGKLYFAADDNIHGRELFVYDGTNTTLVKDINPGLHSSNPFDFYILNNKIIFKAYTLDKGYELWITDGTEAGTKIIKDINPNRGDAFLNDGRAYVRIGEFTVYNNQLYFFANNGTNGMEPWKTDGTEAGTVLIKDINPGASSCFNYALDWRPKFTEYKNQLYFMASRSGTDANLAKNEIWKTNGTTAGTLIDTSTNFYGKEGSFGLIFAFNNYLYFTAEGRYTRKGNLFKTDGTNAGTKTLEVIASSANQPQVLENKIYYRKDGANGAGMEIWSIDKEDTISMVKDFVEGTTGSDPSNFYTFNNYFYFSIRTTANQPELWRLSDTTEPEKLFTKDTESGTTSLDFFFDYIPNGDKLFVNTYHYNNTSLPYKMYQFKNSSTTPTPVFSLDSKVYYNNIAGDFKSISAFYDNKLFFTANIQDKGEELVVVDLNTLSIDENYIQKVNAKNFTIFPNPVNDILNIGSNSTIKSASIYNLLGMKILTTNSKTTNVSMLNPGVYILKVEDEFGTSSSQKWIKK